MGCKQTLCSRADVRAGRAMGLGSSSAAPAASNHEADKANGHILRLVELTFEPVWGIKPPAPA